MSQIDVKTAIAADAAQQHQPQPEKENSPAPKPKSSSPRKLASCQTNGKQSTGATTPEGKAICASTSGNFRHGMLAQTVVLASESRARFEALVDNYMTEYCPATTTERELVETMAAARWRILRVLCVQKNEIDLEIAHQQSIAPKRHSPPVAATLAIRSLCGKTSALGNMSRYETAFERQYHRAHSKLKKLQDERNKDRKSVGLPTSVSPIWDDCSGTFDNES